MTDRVTGYATRPSPAELADKSELGAASRDFRDTLETVNRARRVALDALMSHREAAMRLTLARNKAEADAPARPKPKPDPLDWDDEFTEGPATPARPESAPASLDDWN